MTVLAFSKETVPIIYIYINRFITRNWFRQLQRLEVSRSGFCELGDQGKPLVQFSVGLKARKSGVSGVGIDLCPISNNQAERANLFLQLFLLFRPSTHWVMSTPWKRANHFIRSKNSNANFTRNTLTDTPKNICQPNIWAPRDPVRLTEKITSIVLNKLETMYVSNLSKVTQLENRDPGHLSQEESNIWGIQQTVQAI